MSSGERETSTAPHNDYIRENGAVLGIFRPGKLDAMAIGNAAGFNCFVDKDETVSRLHDALVKDNDIYALAVVDGEYRVQGIIVRREFFNLLSSPDKRELYSRRTVASLMRQAPVFSADANVLSVSDEISDKLNQPSMTYYMLVREPGRFAGIFSSKDILVYLSEMTKKDIESAKKLQSGIVRAERLETSERVSMVGASSMARGIGGDFYDFKNYDNENWFITVCDVSGKGIAASTIPPLIGGMLSGYDFRNGIRKFVVTLNDYLFSKFNTEIYVTGVFSVINTRNMETTLFDTGHSYLFIHRDGKLLKLATKEENIPMGIQKELQIRGVKFTAQPGDIMVLLTDGVIEQRGSGDEKYGEKRLGDLITRYRDMGLKRIKDEVFAEVAVHRGNLPQQDDMTLVMVEYR